MNSQLYQLSEENIYTLLSYYELIKEKSEHYQTRISKFNKMTNTYFNNIKNIFIDEEGSNDKKEKINSENNKIDLTKKLGNSVLINIAISKDNIVKKKIDISPIEFNVQKINKLFHNYNTCIDLFIKCTENLYSGLNQNLEKTKTRINEIQNNYSLEKLNFLQKYSEFEELNKKLHSKYFEQEKNLVQYIIKTQSLKTKENEQVQNKEENELNLGIFNNKKIEKETEKQFHNFSKFGKSFNDSYDIVNKEIQDVIETFFKEFELQINNSLILYKKSFFTPINQLSSERDILTPKESEFNDILIKNIKNIDSKLNEINFDEYKIKVLNKKIFENIDGDENAKILVNLLKNANKTMNESDIYLVAKKMYNFKYVNKKDYILDIEKEIINLNEKINKLFFYAKLKKENNWNLIYGINKSEDKSNNQGSNNDGDIFEENILVKSDVKDEDVDYICKLMKKKVYSNHFLVKLNNFRAMGSSLKMPETIYNYVIRIILEISKYQLVEEKQTDSGQGKIIDFETIRYIFILAQTFYYLKDDKKIYLQQGLKNIQTFHLVDIWIEVIENNMKEDIDKKQKKMKNKLDEKEYHEIAKNLCFIQLLPYINGLIGFGVDKKALNEIVSFFVDKYQIKEEEQTIIKQTIEDSVNK